MSDTTMTEEQFLQSYDPTRYERPIGVPADIVLFTVTSESITGSTKSLPKRELKVMLIKRKGHPDRGKWALPGGFSSPQETLYEAAKRELVEETGVDDIHLELLGLYDTPGRDKRGWVISAAFVALVNERYLEKRKANDDAEEVRLFSMEEALQLELAFDHRNILEDARKHTERKMLVTTIARELLDLTFTLAELLQVIQTVVPSYTITKTNFIRKMLNTRSHPIVEPVEGECSTAYSQRPAQLYRFVDGYVPSLSIYVDAPSRS
ncbi:NUDIX domain-containing protein [Paenibacillus sp. 1001270B_150601_E10]|uniref:NUDIX domain-containing protein n=1 Tax=Paenibacillus sp. 1001270B_150601_E10 TaxID=2787079 RepID=UPI001E4D3E33|nr:NUDIX domain-containing protein [Paenibacillus sp. 1001270B_150601_E10]